MPPSLLSTVLGDLKPEYAFEGQEPYYDNNYSDDGNNGGASNSFVRSLKEEPVSGYFCV